MSDLPDRCSHGVSWLKDCPDCDLTAARELVERFGPAVDAARAVIKRSEPPKPIPKAKPRLIHCAANRDGECSHEQCPQTRDGEPAKSGRSCPKPQWEDE